ncbi:MAG: ABC transporter permease [Roseburia sp.]|nr:ABC transporter permease [Roseburia sp.]MCM1098283.1 ABC transporter permease [Ruminococcus flavefaciens]
MLNKLAFRNMKRSARDYAVYFLTMTVVTALMYSFNSLFFQNELAQYYDMQGVDLMAILIGLATFFILLIVAWLIHYMVRFLLEKRSTEFGIYLLLGMKKKKVSGLYIRENILLGSAAFLLGGVLGIFLQQILFTVMFSMVRREYHLHISVDRRTVLMTALCYAGCYLLALVRCRRKFRKMSIQALMNAKRQNEEIREKYEGLKRVILPLSVLFLFLFWAAFGRLSDALQIILFLVGLVVTIYLFYLGLSAWIICYVRKKGEGIYRGQNLFLLRQFASKVRTMQFTLGTLTSLFTLALLGTAIVLLFSEYENTVMEERFPFDVQIFSEEPDYDFEEELGLLKESAPECESFLYRIYTDGGIQANIWMMTHLKDWGETYLREDGTPDYRRIEESLKKEIIYYCYDTYMGLSDYNYLRGMLGYEACSLGEDEYLIQVTPRLYEEVQDMGKGLQIFDGAGKELLNCAGIKGDPFSQSGHNGADYLIVVPDSVLSRMRPYYSELAAMLKAPADPELQKRLLGRRGEEETNDYLEEESDDYLEEKKGESDFCVGVSDNIIGYTDVCIVREIVNSEIKYVLGSVMIPLFYIGMVFVCVGMTVLSVQQLSDSAKYRFRYEVLSKLGMSRRRIQGLVLRQLAGYYFCPALLAVIISGKMILFVSEAFVEGTGVPTAAGGFFLRSILLFFGIYLVYFAVTYVNFRRNVEEKR